MSGSFANIRKIAKQLKAGGRGGIGGAGSMKIWGQLGMRIGEQILLPALEELALNTAQYTGTAASNWMLGVGGNPGNFEEISLAKGEKPKKLGDREASNIVLSNNADIGYQITYNLFNFTSVSLYNNTPHILTAIGQGNELRPVNQGAENALQEFEDAVEGGFATVDLVL